MKKTCKKCNGVGKVEDIIEAIIDYMDGADDFPCEKCPRCKGTGKEPKRNSYEWKHWI